MKDQEIKDLWRLADQDSEFSYTKNTLVEILSKGSQNIIVRFINTLRLEQKLNTLGFLLLTIYFVYIGRFIESIVVIALNLGFYLGYQNLIKKLQVPAADEGVLHYLHKTSNLIRRFIKHYQIASLLLGIPIYFLVLYHLKGELIWTELTSNPEFILINALGLFVAYAIVIYLIHLLYGKKYIKIKEMINSLSQAE